MDIHENRNWLCQIERIDNVSYPPSHHKIHFTLESGHYEKFYFLAMVIVSDENYDVNNFYIELSRLLLNRNSLIISSGSQPDALFKTFIEEYCHLKFQND